LVSLGKVDDRLFVSLVTVGLSVVVSKNVSDKIKLRFGRIGYILNSLWHGASHEAFDIIVETLNDEYYTKTHQLLIANSEIAFPTDTTYGVDVFEPKIGIISYADNSNKFAHAFGAMQSLLKRKPVEYAIKVSTQYAEITTSKPRSVAVDGEVFGETLITFSVVKDAVSVVIP